MFFGLNEIMDKARKAYTKLFKQWSKWSQERYGTKKKSNATSKRKK
jgi:hypothetical protein